MVANKFLQDVHLTDNERKEVVPICQYIHTSARNLSERYFGYALMYIWISSHRLFYALLKQTCTRLSGESWQQQTTNKGLQKTDAHLQFTGRMFLSSHLSQSNCCTNPNKTSKSKFATHPAVYRAKPNTYTTSFTRTTTTKTLPPVITTETTDPTRRTPDRQLLRCRQVPYIKGTSKTIARILQPYGIRVAHKPIATFRQLLTNFKDKVEQRTDRERYTRSNATTAPQLTLARRAET